MPTRQIGFGEPFVMQGAPGLPWNGLPHDLISQALRPFHGLLVGRGRAYTGPVAAGSGGGWVVTDIAGTGSIAGIAGGGFAITTGTTDENSTQAQFTAERFSFNKSEAGKKSIIMGRVKVSTAATTGALFGIATVDTTVWTAAAGAVDFNDGIVFYKDATATDLTVTCRRAGSAHWSQACGLTITDDAWMVVAVVIESISATQSIATVYARMDPNDVFTNDPNAAGAFLGAGTKVAAFNDNLQGLLAPVFICGQEGGTTARVLSVDWAIFVEGL